MDTNSIRTATPADLRFILALQRNFSNQIGYIPAGPTLREIDRGRVAIGELNATEAGMLLWQPALTSQPTTAAIIQAAVRMDAQRQALGLTLVNTIAQQAAAAGTTILQAWCRSDLESNLFWAAAGFSKIATREGGKGRNHPMILWRLPLLETADLRAMPIDKKPRGPGGQFSRETQAIILTEVASQTHDPTHPMSSASA
jgi:hypothetical protein